MENTLATITILGLLVACGHCLVVNENTDPAFMSVSTLLSMLKAEEAMVIEMKNLIEEKKIQGPSTLSAVMKYVQRYEKMTSTGRSAEDIASHPIDTYHLMKDVAMGWMKINKTYEKEKQSISGLLDDLFTLRQDYKYPEFLDLPRLATSIVRLQDCYQLNVEDLVRGTLVDPVTKKIYDSIRPLNSWDCVTMSRSARQHQFHGNAIDWLQEAMKLQMSGDESIPLSVLEEDLREASVMHDDVLIRKGYRGPGWKTNKRPVDPALAESFQERLAYGDAELQPNLYSYMEYADLQQQQFKLCRGEKLRPAGIDDHLACRYVTNGHSYLLLQPLKAEELSDDIPIMMFRDFVSDSEIEKMQMLASPHLSDSVVFYRNKENALIGFKGNQRTAKQFFLADAKDSKFSAHLLRRYEMASKLNLKYEYRESVKIMNYSPGGHYVLHNDFKQDPNIPDDQNELLPADGDMIATLLIYLSDVEAGGATVFPVVGVVATPEKGSLMMWYNLDKAGVADYSAYHAGCPVIYGSKWISTVRPFLYDQMFTYKCGENVWDRHTLL